MGVWARLGEAMCERKTRVAARALSLYWSSMKWTLCEPSVMANSLSLTAAMPHLKTSGQGGGTMGGSGLHEASTQA